jgi:hypothetical protein
MIVGDYLAVPVTDLNVLCICWFSCDCPTPVTVPVLLAVIKL